jgi:hypothetical protein
MKSAGDDYGTEESDVVRQERRAALFVIPVFFCHPERSRGVNAKRFCEGVSRFELNSAFASACHSASRRFLGFARNDKKGRSFSVVNVDA